MINQKEQTARMMATIRGFNQNQQAQRALRIALEEAEKKAQEEEVRKEEEERLVRKRKSEQEPSTRDFGHFPEPAAPCPPALLDRDKGKTDDGFAPAPSPSVQPMMPTRANLPTRRIEVIRKAEEDFARQVESNASESLANLGSRLQSMFESTAKEGLHLHEQPNLCQEAMDQALKSLVRFGTLARLNLYVADRVMEDDEKLITERALQYQSRIQELEEQVQTLDAARKADEQEIVLLKEEIKLNEELFLQKIDDMKAQIEQVRRNEAELKTQVQTLRDVEVSSKARIEQLESDTESSEKHRREIDIELKSTQEQLITVDQLLTLTQKKYEQTESALQLVMQSRLSQRITAQPSATMEAQNEEVKRVRQLLDNSRMENLDLGLENLKMKRELEELKKQVQELQAAKAAPPPSAPHVPLPKPKGMQSKAGTSISWDFENGHEEKQEEDPEWKMTKEMFNGCFQATQTRKEPSNVRKKRWTEAAPPPIRSKKHGNQPKVSRRNRKGQDP